MDRSPSTLPRVRAARAIDNAKASNASWWNTSSLASTAPAGTIGLDAEASSGPIHSAACVDRFAFIIARLRGPAAGPVYCE